MGYEGLIGETITMRGHNGEPIEAYLARPIGVSNVPGVVVIHEASNSGLTDRAKGVKKTFKGTTKTLLIPNAKADIPGTQAKIKAYFAANKSTDALLGLDPDVTVPAQQVAPAGTKVGTFVPFLIRCSRSLRTTLPSNAWFSLASRASST